MPELATLGGGAAEPNNAERISALHQQQSPALIRALRTQFASDVNVDVRRHTQERQAAYETYFTTTEAAPIAGQPLQGIITAPGAAVAGSLEANKADAAVQIQRQLQANQEIRREDLRNIGTKLETKYQYIIDQTDTRSTIGTEITQVVRANDVYLNDLATGKNAAVASVNALYTDDYRNLLKTAYGIDNAEVAAIQNRHLQSVKDEYDKQINGAKTYTKQLYKDFLDAETRIEKNFKTRQLYGKFFAAPELGEALAGVGGEGPTLEEMERSINEATTFTVNVAPDRSFTNVFGLFDTKSPEVKIHKTPEGKLMIALEDINSSSIEALLDIAQQQGKTTLNLNFDPSDPKNKAREDKIRSEMAWRGALRSPPMSVAGAKDFSPEALQKLNLIRAQQRHVRTMLNDTEARQTKAAGQTFVFINEISRRIQVQKAQVESLSNEFRTLNAAAAGDAALHAKANELVGDLGRLGNELARLQAQVPPDADAIAAKQAEIDNITVLRIAKLERELATLLARVPLPVDDIRAKREEIRDARALPAAAGIGAVSDGEEKNRVLLAQYNKIKGRSNELAELISNQFDGLQSLHREVNPFPLLERELHVLQADPATPPALIAAKQQEIADARAKFDRLNPDQQQNILNALRNGLASINDGITAEKRLHEVPVGPAGAPAVQSIEQIIHNAAGANPVIFGGADAEIARFHTDSTQRHERNSQDEQRAQNALQNRAVPPAPAPGMRI